MKLISYARRGECLRRRQGWRDRRYVRSAEFTQLGHVIAGFSINEMEKLSAGTDPDIDLDQIDYMFPITSPEKIFCIGRNYRPTKYWKTADLNGSVFSALRVRVHTAKLLASPPSQSSWITKEKSVIMANRDGTSRKRRRWITLPDTRSSTRRVRIACKGTQNCPGKNFYRSGAIGPGWRRGTKSATWMPSR